MELLKQSDRISDIGTGGAFSAYDPYQDRMTSELSTYEWTPLLSTIVGMNPSPDWFTGISSLDLRQATTEGYMWYRAFQVDTYPLTAGTLAGSTYTDPGTTIRNSIQPVAIGNASSPVARWTCELLNAIPVLQTNSPTLASSLPQTLPPTITPTVSGNATMTPITTEVLNTTETVSRANWAALNTGPHFMSYP